MYTFEGQEYKKNAETAGNLMTDFIDIGPRREKQTQNYNIDSYYRAALVTKPKTESVT